MFVSHVLPGEFRHCSTWLTRAVRDTPTCASFVLSTYVLDVSSRLDSYPSAPKSLGFAPSRSTLLSAVSEWLHPTFNDRLSAFSMTDVLTPICSLNCIIPRCMTLKFIEFDPHLFCVLLLVVYTLFAFARLHLLAHPPKVLSCQPQHC